MKPSKKSHKAVVSYCIDESSAITIDVNIDDYSEDTLEKFSLLFASIPTEGFQMQAMQIMQQAFENDGKQDEFEYFIGCTMVKQQMLKKGQKDSKKGDNDPLIEPTDLI